MVGDGAGVAGHVGGGGVEFVGEAGEGAVDAGGVMPVEGDGDRLGGVGDGATVVHEAAHDGSVFVGVLEVGVEVVGEPGVGVV